MIYLIMILALLATTSSMNASAKEEENEAEPIKAMEEFARKIQETQHVTPTIIPGKLPTNGKSAFRAIRPIGAPPAQQTTPPANGAGAAQVDLKQHAEPQQPAIANDQPANALPEITPERIAQLISVFAVQTTPQNHGQSAAASVGKKGVIGQTKQATHMYDTAYSLFR